jgi:signal transduction histidine kinase
MEIQDRRRIDIFFSTTPGQRTGIRITNNGPAIPADLQEKIFVPFFTTKKEGSGIGLSISQEIVKLHKGSLLLTTSIEGHTCFVVEV